VADYGWCMNCAKAIPYEELYQHAREHKHFFQTPDQLQNVNLENQ